MVDIPRIIYSGMTKSLGKRASSDSLLAAFQWTGGEKPGVNVLFQLETKIACKIAK
jgi:hypothetical protein